MKLSLGQATRGLVFTFFALLITVIAVQPTFADQNHEITLSKSKKQRFPLGPHPELTPGKLCDTPSELRYPEKIKYCKRSVHTSVKKAIIAEYDDEYGYQVESMDRKEFKIDHYIPLCAGGSNDEENLWPQHKSVYEITDPLEPLVCGKMAEGKLKQADAVRLVIEAKNDLARAPEIIEYVESL